MGCLFLIFAGAFPRLATLFIWIARPTMFNAAFGGSFLWPLLGIIFLPFTTLMYVILWSATGLTGWDWVWLAIAGAIDVTNAGANAYSNRNRLGYPGTTA